MESEGNMKKNEMEVSKKVKENLGKSLQLPSDVMFDIFLRLSAKDLSRFSCVSKDFLTCISSPYFHRLRSSINPFSFSLSLIDESDYRCGMALVRKPILLSIADHEGHTICEFTRELEVDGFKHVVLVPSHHNLVCVVTRNHIYICNPNKQEFLELPTTSDIRLGPLSVGFGYLPSKNEYKVVRCPFIRYDDEDINNNELGCDILTISNYGSGTNNDNNNKIDDCCSEWRVLEGGCPHMMASYPVLVNGSVHWKIDDQWNRGENEEIMSFNLEEEKFRILPAPGCVKENPQCFSLAALKGQLWVNHFEYGIRQVMDMWVLKDFDKFTWVKEYSIDISTLNMFRVDEGTVYVLNVRNEEVLIRMGLRKQVYFNLKTKRFRDFVNADNRFCFCCYTDVVPFY